MSDILKKIIENLKNIFSKKTKMLSDQTFTKLSDELETLIHESEELIQKRDEKIKELDYVTIKELEISLELYRLEEKFLTELKRQKQEELDMLLAK